jgi:hypothetical protein
VEANQMTGLVEESQEDLQPRPHRSRRADMQAMPCQASNKWTRQPSPDSLASSLSKDLHRTALRYHHAVFLMPVLHSPLLHVVYHPLMIRCKILMELLHR